jgi:hypothetical protein
MGFDAERFLHGFSLRRRLETRAAELEAASLRAEHESGLNESDWQAATGPYLPWVIATGRFPMIAKVVSGATHRPT